MSNVFVVVSLFLVDDLNCQIFNSYRGYCASNPCDRGSCSDSALGYECSCVIGYGGQNCETKLAALTPQLISNDDPSLFEYNNHGYRIITRTVDFHEANDSCAAVDGYLACINTLEEYGTLQAMFSGLSQSLERAWVGLFWYPNGNCSRDTSSGELVCAWNFRCLPEGANTESADVWFEERATLSLYFTSTPTYPLDYWTLSKHDDISSWALLSQDEQHAFICEFEVHCHSRGKTNPCLNNGICTVINEMNYVCDCTNTGYTGDFCETELCAFQGDYTACPCESNPCMNNGTCSNSGNGRHVLFFACDCSGTGFEGDTCNSDVNECILNNINTTVDLCNDRGICVNRVGTYACNCFPGFEGRFCENQVEAAARDASTSNECENDATVYAFVFLGCGVIAGCVLFISLFKKILKWKAKPGRTLRVRIREKCCREKCCRPKKPKAKAQPAGAPKMNQLTAAARPAPAPVNTQRLTVTPGTPTSNRPVPSNQLKQMIVAYPFAMPQQQPRQRPYPGAIRRSPKMVQSLSVNSNDTDTGSARTENVYGGQSLMTTATDRQSVMTSSIYGGQSVMTAATFGQQQSDNSFLGDAASHFSTGTSLHSYGSRGSGVSGVSGVSAVSGVSGRSDGSVSTWRGPPPGASLL